jgi:hypothetical protein
MADALGNFRFAGAAAAATLISMRVPGIDTLCSVKKMCLGFSTRLVADLYWVVEVPDPH